MDARSDIYRARLRALRDARRRAPLHRPHAAGRDRPRASSSPRPRCAACATTVSGRWRRRSARALSREPPTASRPPPSSPGARQRRLPRRSPGPPAPEAQRRSRPPLGRVAGSARLPATVALLALGFVLGLGALFAWLWSAGGGEACDRPHAPRGAPLREPGRLGRGVLRRRGERRGTRQARRASRTPVIAGASSGEYRRTTKSPRRSPASSAFDTCWSARCAGKGAGEQEPGAGES